MEPYNYEIENKRAQTFVKNMALHFHPEDAATVDTFQNSPEHRIDEHYTFSMHIDPALRSQIEPIALNLQKLDSNLILSDPDLYHVTLFWCGLEQNIDALIKLIESHIAKEPLEFYLHGIFAAPNGISAKVYPSNNSFFELRKKLYAATGIGIPMNQPPLEGYHERAVSTWVTLARYPQLPTQAAIDFCNSKLDQDFGAFKPEAVVAYITNNKFLKDPKLVKKIVN